MKQPELIRLAVSCVGSGIGQSIVNSCRLSALPIEIIGFDVNPMAYGIHDCDVYIQTPRINEFGYLDSIISMCVSQKIDLLIPGVDDEVLLFSKHLNRFSAVGVKVLVSDEALVSLCRDKEKMFHELRKVAPIFAKTYNTENFQTAYEKNEISFPVILKPRGGSASQGIVIADSLADIASLSEDFIIQEIAIPHEADTDRMYFDRMLSKRINPQVSEISIQIIADITGVVRAEAMTINKLKNGVPVEIIPYENQFVRNEVARLFPKLKSLGIKGPLNIQGRLTDSGFKIFEMNPRFTGITGLRALMGFNEVEACIRLWLTPHYDLVKHALELNSNRFGVRQMADKVVSTSKLAQHSQKSKRSIIPQKKKLLITGATGYLGRNLIESILRQNLPFSISVLVRDKKKAATIFTESVSCYDFDDLQNGGLSLGGVDLLLHAAFARPYLNQNEIASALAMTATLFQRAVANQVPQIINISSQSVYGQCDLPPWTENTTIAPQTTYSTAKYATELLLEALASQNKHIQYTSLRLGTIVGGAKGLVAVDLVSRWVSQALKLEPLVVMGGTQIIERLDLRDAISGIEKIILSNQMYWKKVYNLGPTSTIQLLDLAEAIVTTVAAETGLDKSKIMVENKNEEVLSGLDSSDFIKDFSWKAKYSIVDSIISLIHYKRIS